MMDLISVIIPVYNVEKYIERCLRSVLAQTYTDLEIIVVDDGSTDRSGVICDEISHEDERIIVIHQENQGASAARNAGLEKMHGAWLTFIDSDDFVAQGYIEYLHELAVSHGVLISQCGYLAGTESSIEDDTTVCTVKKWQFGELYASKNRDFRVVPWGKLYKSSLFEDYRFPVGKIAEDEDMTFKIMYKAGSSVISSKRLYYYFQAEGSVSRTYSRKSLYDFVGIFDDRIDFLKNRNENELLRITEKEMCIRLALGYVDTINHNDIKNSQEMRALFLKHYEKIASFRQFSFKEKVTLKLFYYQPGLFVKVSNVYGR